MNASLIAVGSEMLTPTRIDTNSLFLTEHLNALGVEVIEKRIVGDDRARLAAAARTAMADVAIVILTGGLGPTEDDVTRDAVADALGRKQSLNESVLAAIAGRFARMGRKMADNNRRQAFVIEGAEILDNPRGTAPGLWIADGDRVVMLLPGPPREMKPMFTELCLPKLRAMLPPQFIATRWFRVAGMGESDLDALIAPVYTKVSNPVTTVLAKPGDVEIHLRSRAATVVEAEKLCNEVGEPILALLGDRVYSINGDPLEAAVGALLMSRGETVSVAESCNGGLLGARLTETPGSSAWFAGGRIVYTAATKRVLIGEFTDDPVSEPVAARLASAIAAETGASWGLSITGIAGPDGGTDEHPLGTIWIGIARRGGSASARAFKFIGERSRIRSMAVQTALDLLRKSLR